MRVLTPAQMRAADAQAFAEVGEVAARYARSRKVVAFAGSGNNGGDAFAALALLPDYERVIYAQDAPRASQARRDAEQRAERAGVERRAFPQSLDDARDAIADCGLVIVGLVGTGARFPLPEAYTNVIRALNESDVRSIAIDIPAGVDGERGIVVEPALRASATVTLAALKPGLILPPGRECVGDLWLADIGMPASALAAQQSSFAALDDAEFLALLPKRAA